MGVDHPIQKVLSFQFQLVCYTILTHFLLLQCQKKEVKQNLCLKY